MARVFGFEPGKSGQQPVLANGDPFAAVGVWGDSDIGVGVFGTSGAVPEGTFIPIESSGAVTGHSAIREGVVGRSVNANGVLGLSHWAAAVVGRSDTTQGVQGFTSGTNGSYGVWGSADATGGGGVFGISDDGNGVAGMTSADAQQNWNVAAVRGESANGLAGLFLGKVRVAGELSKSGGGFTIDHPKDPENKYLSHSFVESPDMMNVYSGNVTTDEDGEALFGEKAIGLHPAHLPIEDRYARP